MRFFRVLPFLSLLFGASASSLDSRAPVAHPLDTRELLDVCASVNVDLEAPNLLGNVLGTTGVIGWFNSPLNQLRVVLIRIFTDVCLCLSALPLFLETNIVALLAVDLVGSQVLTDLLTKLVRRKLYCTLKNVP